MSAYQYAVQNEILFPTYFRTQKEAFAYAKEIGGKVVIYRKGSGWNKWWTSEKGYVYN